MAFRPVLIVDPTVFGVWQNTVDDQQFFKWTSKCTNLAQFSQNSGGFSEHY